MLWLPFKFGFVERSCAVLVFNSSLAFRTHAESFGGRGMTRRSDCAIGSPLFEVTGQSVAGTAAEMVRWLSTRRYERFSGTPGKHADRHVCSS